MAIPNPIRCRGVELEPGVYSGCAYGSGEIRALQGPCDCPTCNGSGLEGVTATWLPHQEFGDPDCDGFLMGITAGDQTYIGCNACEAIVRILPASELQRVLDEMELAMDSCSLMCPHCGKINLLVGFSQVLIYNCHECGKPVPVANE